VSQLSILNINFTDFKISSLACFDELFFVTPVMCEMLSGIDKK
jgi:hypothetical protein